MSRALVASLLSLALLACSDDGQPPADKGITIDVKKLGDGQAVPEARAGDIGSSDIGGSGFPEASAADQGSWKCTAGEANMCDGYKTQYCLSGVCTACPANKTDCDWKGDCECAGVCDGTKCKTQ